VVSAVGSALEAKTARARDLGVAAGRICVDPGLGFGKSVAQNLALMGHAGWFCERFGRAGSGVLWGASRKSFVGAVTGVQAPADRVLGSVGVACAVACGGGRLFRVHDVRAHREALAAAFGVSRMAWAGGVA
jgi:dihydropteroate synthase